MTNASTRQLTNITYPTTVNGENVSVATYLSICLGLFHYVFCMHRKEISLAYASTEYVHVFLKPSRMFDVCPYTVAYLCPVLVYDMRGLTLDPLHSWR